MSTAVSKIKPETKVRTLYQFSETGVIAKPSKGEGGPTPEWYVVQFDESGGRMCVHETMLAVSNAVSA